MNGESKAGNARVFACPCSELPSEDDVYFNDDYEVDTSGEETEAVQDSDKVADDEVETSGEETEAVQPKERDHEIIDECDINRSYFTD